MAFVPRASPTTRLALVCFASLALSCLTRKEAPKAVEPDKAPVDEPAEPSKDEKAWQPGAEAYPKPLQATLKAALDAKGSDYKPRTHHLKPDGAPVYLNRLILENSPYLLQHAHNPVDWRPWGDEAFEAARRLGRPVLLSVGYATCHWCHVMERESFEDIEIATYINANYIAIKVDRERRPDVDSLYMKAVQVLTGRGGWPMTVVMNHDREPFFAGTYFPARDGDRGARKGFFTILKELQEGFATGSDEMVEKARSTSARMKRMSSPSRPSTIPGAQALNRGAKVLAERFDPVNGGFGPRPKFPRPVSMEMLLQYHRRTKDAKALEMVVFTLKKMAGGGVYDHLGGGFHRYSVDSRWLVPHFEKMLYDNAQLAMLYLEAWQLSGDPDLLRVSREILDYVAKEMTSKEGVFFSATDADSANPEGHQEEGWFFTWTPAELDALLNPDEARAIKAYYGVTARGNFEGRNIFNTPRTLTEVAKTLGLTPEVLTGALNSARPKLYEARSKRPWPLTDDKILVGWNGLMISAFARVGQATANPLYIARGVRAADFLMKKMLVAGELKRVYNGDKVSHRAVLTDYAFFTAALLDLFEATHNPTWLGHALRLSKMLEQGFWDDKGGAYYMAHKDTDDLMVREKRAYDGAVPAGNSVAIRNLMRFYELTGDQRYRDMAEKGLSAFGSTLAQRIIAMPLLGTALDFYLDQPKQLVIVKPDKNADIKPFLTELGGRYLPNRVLAITAQGAQLEALQRIVPLVEGKVAQGGKVTAYVCEARVCKRPTTDPKVFAKQIAEVSPYSGGPFETLAPAQSP